MTQKEKELLLKDLCARLPYGVIVSIKEVDSDRKPWFGELSCKDLDCFIHDVVYESIKPYLRPMSSMTEEEEIIYEQLIKDVHYKPRVSTCFKLISWLKEHHFDDNYLIPKGLALEAPEDMYKEE